MFNQDRNAGVQVRLLGGARGRPAAMASETGTWLDEHFTETLGDMKQLVDDFFVSGVNHVFYHGTCYSPDEAAWPGWLFYAATEMNPRNAIWHDVPALNAYIARCQSILQAGRPDNDILLYWPIHDLWHNPEGIVQNFTVHALARKQPVGERGSSGIAASCLTTSPTANWRCRPGTANHVPGGPTAWWWSRQRTYAAGDAGSALSRWPNGARP